MDGKMSMGEYGGIGKRKEKEQFMLSLVRLLAHPGMLAQMEKKQGRRP
jgi:hypothetical protein